MRQMQIDGVIVNAPEDTDYAELKAYVDMYRKKYPSLRQLDIEFEGEFANVYAHTAKVPFERIRRITGYLVGAMPRWNDAKRAEEHDRVKHSLEA